MGHDYVTLAGIAITASFSAVAAVWVAVLTNRVKQSELTNQREKDRREAEDKARIAEAESVKREHDGEQTHLLNIERDNEKLRGQIEASDRRDRERFEKWAEIGLTPDEGWLKLKIEHDRQTHKREKKDTTP